MHTAELPEDGLWYVRRFFLTRIKYHRETSLWKPLMWIERSKNYGYGKTASG